jgi:hypothetical protein
MSLGWVAFGLDSDVIFSDAILHLSLVYCFTFHVGTAADKYVEHQLEASRRFVSPCSLAWALEGVSLNFQVRQWKKSNIKGTVA